MRAGIILIVIVVLAVAGYFIFFNKSENKESKDVKQQALHISKNSDSFNVPFNKLLQNYFELKQSLVNWDSAQATKAAENVAEAAEAVPYNTLRADTNVIATAKSFSDNIIAESKSLSTVNGIENKRRSFNSLSDALYNLIRTVQYDGEVIYHMTCPMAFNGNESAYWLSEDKKIVNPYMGNKHPKYHSGMINCGEVIDSVDFRQKQ